MKNRSIPSTHAERKITVHSHKHSFTPYPSLSRYSPTHGMTNRGTNTLAACGLEELFFPVVPLCQFFSYGGEIVLGVTDLPYQLCRYVFFWLWRVIVFGCTGQFFGCGGK